MTHALVALLPFLLLPATLSRANERSESRIRGLVLGSFIGDALGGPVEFQSPEAVAALPNPPKRWRAGGRLDKAALEAAASRLKLRSYASLRSEPGSYAHWKKDAPPGTITDDSRHKIVLIDAIRTHFPLTARGLARAYIDWPSRAKLGTNPSVKLVELRDDWIEEWQLSARWVIGERDPAKALPPARMWTGLPTCCGQMTLPPLACAYVGNPVKAYRAAYELSWFDNGFGKDLNCALIAGLSEALNGEHPFWDGIIKAMRDTDPYRYGKVRYTRRPVDKWLDYALGAAKKADRQPAVLFADFEKTFADTIKWEAQVPFAVTFALLEMCPDDPLAALQLSIEWGHDTDSYAALVGAFIGARYGDSIFPKEMKDAVIRRTREDYGEDLEAWVELLLNLP